MSWATRVLTVYLEDVSGEGLDRITNSIEMTKGVVEVKEGVCPPAIEVHLAQMDLRRELSEIMLAVLSGKKFKVIE